MENNQSIVIKLGGSLLFNEDKSIAIQKINSLCNIIKDSSRFRHIVIICGGGIIAREYINVVRKFTNNEAQSDLMGIQISRINSGLIISCLKDQAYPLVPETMKELAIATLSNRIIVMGGLQPGQSTTSVAVEVSELLKAEEIVILTDVSGIFDKDPKRFIDAKLYKSLTHDELQSILFNDASAEQAAAGEYRIFDAVSLQLIRRSNIKVLIMSGKDLKEFEKFWKGEKDFISTIIHK